MSYTNIQTEFINWSSYPPAPAYGNIQIIDVTDATTYSLSAKGNYYFTHVGYDGSSTNDFTLTVPFASTVDGETFVVMFDGIALAIADVNNRTIELSVSNPAPGGRSVYKVALSSSWISCVYTFIGVSGGWTVAGACCTGS